MDNKKRNPVLFKDKVFEAPEGFGVRSLVRYPDHVGWLYTSHTGGKNPQDTGYSLIDHPKNKLPKGIHSRIEVWENDTGECVGKTEIRSGYRGALLIYNDGREEQYLTSTVALSELMKQLIGNEPYGDC